MLLCYILDITNDDIWPPLVAVLLAAQTSEQSCGAYSFTHEARLAVHHISTFRILQRLAGSKQKELEASAMALMAGYTPLAAVLLICLVPIFEPVGIIAATDDTLLGFPYTFQVPHMSLPLPMLKACFPELTVYGLDCLKTFVSAVCHGHGLR